MPRARSAFLVVGPLLGVLSACGWDWRVRTEEASEAGPLDAGPDAATPLDAGADVVIAPRDAEAGPPPDCTSLAQEVDRTRKDARLCELGKGQCQTTVKDACDCDVVVAVPGSATVIAYEQAVNALRASGCPRGCASACPTTSPRNCLQQLAEIVCVP